ncbi:MAG: GTP cyclohydrolase I FolE [Anaerolineaceae bacterium]|nr:GTP cyclohydrolase I FolE [Anaerolineaceae bacterium]
MTELNDKKKMQDAVRNILVGIGEDPDREGLSATPERVQRMYGELCAGYHMDLDTVVHGAVFEERCDGMILVRNISFYSLCEHHMLPFYGKIHVAYVPDGKIIGLSKIPRIIEMYARRLQVQERLTEQVLSAVETILHPKGTAILTKGLHMCSIMRGVKKESAELITARFTGVFNENQALKDDFYRQIDLQGPAE